MNITRWPLKLCTLLACLVTSASLCRKPFLVAKLTSNVTLIQVKSGASSIVQWSKLFVFTSRNVFTSEDAATQVYMKAQPHICFYVLSVLPLA